jgi:hypothetical protein
MCSKGIVSQVSVIHGLKSVTKSLVIVQILHLGIPVLVRVDTQVMGLHVQVSYTCSMNIQTSKDEDFLKINDVENRLIDFKISPSFEGRVSLKK